MCGVIVEDAGRSRSTNLEHDDYVLLIVWISLITHKYRESQQFLRVEYSTQIYWFDTRGAKEYSQVFTIELSIQPHLKDLMSAAKYLVAK